MRVVLDDGEIIDLAVTEATPTITLVDYSRRETDDFGVTTVVERNFARRMAVKLILPFDQASALQRTLAGLRATAAQWVADDRFAWLDFRGFYRDFEIDLAVPPISYCTLTVEGLAATEAFTDTGEDPAPNGDASTLLLLQPVTIADAALVSSNVPENDAPEWSAGTSYPVGARVIKAATHRIYESGAAGNVGNDPAGASGKWTDIGPINRWAMFDQALGSVTTRPNSIAVTLAAGTVDAVALLDVTAGATVRVQTAGYDRSQTATDGATITFLDLPGGSGQVTVAVSGSGLMSIGTLLVGSLVGLGSTLESPKAGITDFSRKEADEFGEVTIVERAWAKRMSLGAMIRTDAIDVVAGRIAAVRAKPSLWIGMDGLDAITAYGFFKDFSIEVDATVSKLSLSIEGLSTAGKIEPLTASAAWPDITDPLGTKPQDNADVTSENTSKDTAAVAGEPAAAVINKLTQLDAAQAQALIDIAKAESDIAALQSAAGGDLSELTASITQLQGEAAQIQLDATQTRQDVLGALTDIAALNSSLSTQGSAITTLQTAATGAAGSIATLQQSAVAGSPNMLANPTFVEGLTRWTFTANGIPGLAAYTFTDATWGTYAHVDGLGSGKSGTCWFEAAPVRIFGGNPYTVATDYDGTGSSLRIEMLWLGADGVELPNTRTVGPTSGQAYFGNGAANRLNSKTTGIAPANAVSLVVRFVFTGSQMMSINLRQAKLEHGGSATSFSDDAAVRTTFEAVSSAGTKIATLENTVSAHGSSISSLATASSTQSGELATLKTRVSANSVNLIKNGSFETGDSSYWSFHNATPWGFHRGGPWGSYTQTTVNIPDGTYAFLDTETIQIDANDWYTFTADVGHFQTGTGVHYCEIIWLDANRGFMGEQAGNIRPQGTNFDATSAQRNDLAVTVLIPAGAVYAYGRIVWRLDGGTVQSFHARQAKFERGRFPTAYSAEASITQTFTALSSQSGTLASLSTRVGTAESAVSSNATAISGLNSSMATLGNTVSTQGASISSQATAISSLQGRAATLETRVSAGGVNLIPNGTFEMGNLNHWAQIGATWSVSTATGTWGAYAGSGTNIPDDGYAYLETNQVDIEANDYYTFSADIGHFQSSGGGRHYCELIFWDATHNVITSAGGAALPSGNNFDPTGANRTAQAVAGFYAPANARFASGRVVWHKYNGVMASMHARQCKLERGRVPTAYTSEASVMQSFSALSNLSTQYASLSSQVAVQGASVSVQQSAINVLQQRTTAFFRVDAVAGDNRAYLSVIADANNGGGVVIGGDLLVDGNALITGTINPEALALGRFVKRAYVGGAGSPAAGQTLLLGAVDLGQTSGNGAYSLEVTGTMTTNVGSLSGTFNGKPLYTTVQADGGFLVVVNKNGVTVASNYYTAAEFVGQQGFGRSVSLSLTRIFDPANDTALGNATVAMYAVRGGYDSGNINEGDYYSRTVSATYASVTASVKAKWTFI